MRGCAAQMKAVADARSPAGADNEAITERLSVDGAHLDNRRLWPACSERQQLSRRHPLCATRPARFRKRISSESLLHGERIAHGRLRFRVGRLGAIVVEGAARGRQMDARLQL